MNGNWSSSLTLFAKNPKPSSLPAGVYLRHDEHTLTIYDGYPKAKYHFLVLPRIPFKLDGTSSSSSTTSAPPPKLALAGGKLSLGTSSSQSKVPDSHLRSLNDLLSSPYASQVLDKLSSASDEVVKLVKEEMRATTKGIEWGVRVGFHAVPSMETVHVHVISDDLVSDRLKNKKHYQSFHPTHGFWLDMTMIQESVKRGERQLPHPARHYESLLKSPLVSFHDDREYSNIPKLKEHLEQAWVANIRAKRRMADSDDKRKLESEAGQNGSSKVRRVEATASSSDTESEKE